MRTGIILFVSAALFSISLIFMGIFIQSGLKEFRVSDRYVTVKGLAEQNVKADIAIWPLPIAATANDLAEAQNAIDTATAKTIAFLRNQGFEENEISIQKTEVTDLLAQAYRSNESTQLRYIIRQSLVVQTGKIDLVIKTQGMIGELFKQGVAIETTPTKYVYNGLNNIKPQMIAEATKNAREGAEQFAHDSHAVLGSIKAASQGQFQILPADSEFQYDESQSPYKKIRVVTTVQYSLDHSGLK